LLRGVQLRIAWTAAELFWRHFREAVAELPNALGCILLVAAARLVVSGRYIAGAAAE
jgi:hypothetical protein